MPIEVLQATLCPPENMLLYSYPSNEYAMFPVKSYPESPPSPGRRRLLEALSRDIHRLFLERLTIPRMVAMSRQMRKQYRRQLQEGQDCMLPSYCTAMPTGQERGAHLALDVGGSTLRLALVDLNGRHDQKPLHIRRMIVAPIDHAVRSLPSNEFFDWIAQRVESMLVEEPGVEAHTPTSWQLGIAWSFPLDQTSPSRGKIMGMGKGFQCHHDTRGQDLGDLIVAACAARGVNVRVKAIVNDSSATLLSQAYLDAATSMGLILGTGTNAAVHLPISSVGHKKFGVRDPSWYTNASKVITNTELSMFGKDILPETRWDEVLNGMHPLPDFQPLEYMTTGRYLGEILRLMIIEAVDTRSLFGGVLPLPLYEAYSLDTILLAKLEEDESLNFRQSSLAVQTTLQLPQPPERHEVEFLRSLASSISHRASAYLAIAIHALWALQKEVEVTPDHASPLGRTSIACNGSVILKYPGFRERCENYVAQLIAFDTPPDGPPVSEKVLLQPTDEAALRGTAVAVALGANDPET